MRERVLHAPREISLIRIREVTNAVRNNPDLPRQVQLALGIKETFKKMPLSILGDELIVGSATEKFKGAVLYPEIKSDSLIKELDNFTEREYLRFEISDEEKRELREDLLPFWEDKGAYEIWESQLSEESKEMLDSLAFIVMNDFVAAAVLTFVDYKQVVERGYESIIKDAEKAMTQVADNDPEAEKKRAFYQSVIISSEGMIELGKRHSQLASELADKTESKERARELREIAEICAHVPAKPARNFREAMQAFWFTFCGMQQFDMAMELAPGRMDQLLYPAYQKDIEEGRLTIEEAKELIDEVMVKFYRITSLGEFAVTRVNDGNATRFTLTVGGTDGDGNDSTNDLSYLFLDSADTIRFVHPNMAIRLHQNTPSKFFNAVANVMTNGSNVMAVFNDEVIVPAFTRIGTPIDDARNYLLTGCVQPMAANMYGPTCSIYLSGPKMLELFLNGGEPIHSLSGEQADNPAPEFDTFEGFYDAFKEYMAGILERAVAEYRPVCEVSARYFPNPLISALTENAIKTGKDVKEGSSPNNMTGVSMLGIGTLVDSLSAIRTFVYEQKAHTLDDLVEMLKLDFEDAEKERLNLYHNTQRFGNGDSKVDMIAKDLVDFVDDVLSKQPLSYRGGRHVISLHSEAQHVYLGGVVAATPDGRPDGTALSPGCGPTSGMEHEGPTASMRSVCAMDFKKMPAGSSYSQRYSPKLFEREEGAANFLSMLKTYFFKLGGQHLHVNTVDSEALREAQRHPGEYEDLLVRVSGYSARFIDLSPGTQEEIIQRTEMCACG
jgi:formate C-acetyltransferase